MRHKGIVAVGPPCAGKGTACRDLAGFFYISTGDLVRDALKQESEFSQRLRRLLKEGKLISDEDILLLLAQRLDYAERTRQYTLGLNYLMLDGIPRNIFQAEQLENIVSLSGVLHFAGVPDSELRRRMEERRNAMLLASGKARDDDSDRAFNNRLIEYREITARVIDFYRSRNFPIWDVDASKSKEDVKRQVIERSRHLLSDAVNAETKKYGA